MPVHTLGNLTPVLPEGPHFIAPGARLIGDVVLEDDTCIMFGAVLRAEFARIHIGKRCNVQDNAVLHVDPGFPITLGHDVTIGHSAIVHGCTIGSGTVIGMGATVLNGAVIGEHSIVGANALVTQGAVFPPRSLILGAPARRLREMTAEEVEGAMQTAAGYVENIALYTDGFDR